MPADPPAIPASTAIHLLKRRSAVRHAGCAWHLAAASASSAVLDMHLPTALAEGRSLYACKPQVAQEMACDACREESGPPTLDGYAAAGLCVSSHCPALGCRDPDGGWIRSSSHARRMGSLLATEKTVTPRVMEASACERMHAAR